MEPMDFDEVTEGADFEEVIDCLLRSGVCLLETDEAVLKSAHWLLFQDE